MNIQAMDKDGKIIMLGHEDCGRQKDGSWLSIIRHGHRTIKINCPGKMVAAAKDGPAARLKHLTERLRRKGILLGELA